ncbi:hypothetical protein EYF80_033231 [Liparis tanakae]|uniref:Uncharacterized protein n=1 Tax=Liparis tanakae TaxID=230148 RepID=A0A4Z2GSV7_9TELE|nr:hypothetical protein EYF80_033231 [Liparis tanakae]
MSTGMYAPILLMFASNSGCRKPVIRSKLEEMLRVERLSASSQPDPPRTSGGFTTAGWPLCLRSLKAPSSSRWPTRAGGGLVAEVWPGLATHPAAAPLRPAWPMPLEDGGARFWVAMPAWVGRAECAIPAAADPAAPPLDTAAIFSPLCGKQQAACAARITGTPPPFARASAAPSLGCNHGDDRRNK